ncbi:type 1 glutamine amidotransferase [Primorskyibacter flagellatus]|uniref:GMP synthase (Glutamine-hydrolysing) n=1 Tax=Primorskyibacter flagellatus TaxID=1387277 RepID=A0A1W2EDQ3_9RHOB|nr:type 1 glutamine amidotransferase [Primorskyibacter flagellatus]SMD07522.1 GMP synthase (glutamine-hydrolysing) [Primorskyibacter flagellatus]
MLIGILQTGHVAQELVAENGDYPEIFAQFLAGRDLSFRNYAVVDGEFPNGPEDAEGWLITGSRFGAYEDHPWIPPLEELIRDIYASGRPMIGVCFGHQIIAQALGGKVEKFAGGWSVGRTSYDILGETVNLNAWHQDQVVVVPDDAEIVSSTDFCENAALLYGDRAFTIQPHPEIDRTYLKGLLDERAQGVVPEPLRQEALSRLDADTDSARLAEMFALFFKEKRIT